MMRLVAILALLVASACSMDTEGSSAPPAPVDPTVEVTGFLFQPSDLQVRVGTEVTWANRDEILHTVTSGEPGARTQLFDGALSDQGTSFSFRFETPGTYPYFCSRHEHMTGIVEVVEA